MRRFLAPLLFLSLIFLLPLQAPAAGVTFQQVSSTEWEISNGIVTAYYNPEAGDIYDLNVLLNGTTYNPINSSVSVPNINHGSAKAEIYNLADENGSGITSNFSIGSDYVDFWDSNAPSSTGDNATVQDHYVIVAGEPGIQMYSVVQHTVADGGAGSLFGQAFVIKASDQNLTGFYMANTSFNSQGTFQYELPPMTTQAEAAAVASRNVQNETIDYTGFTPTPTITETYSATTGQTGTIASDYITKYNYSTSEEDHTADGVFGTEPNGTTLGMWAVYPSHESETGGPNDQDSDGESSQPMLTPGYGSSHYGGAQYVMPAGNSSRLFGPFDLYFNATNGSTLTTPTQLYDNAAAQADTFTNVYDNESTLLSDGYVPSTQRGIVTAKLTDSGGWSSDEQDNVVVLADNDTNFQASNQGDQYWGYVNPATDSLTIPGVVPGEYRLSAYVRGQFGELRMNNVVVNSNDTTTITGLTFVPESFGTTVWTIGTPDRSANEFEFGHITGTNLDSRNYQGSYDYYGALANSAIPGAVDYYATAVGGTPATNSLANFPMNMWYQFDPNEYAGVYNSSDTTEDGYNYVVAKSAPYVGNPATYVPPPWEVHFTLTPMEEAEKYVDLSIGIAAEEADLTVSLNGHSLLWKGYQRMSTVNDPMQRSGVSGYYQWVVFQWNTSDLNAAGDDNVIDLSVNRENGVMWDAFRMEVSNTGANPTTTGWSDYEFLYNSTDTLVNDAVASDDGNPVETIVPEPSSLALAMAGAALLAVRRQRRKYNS